MSVDYSLKILTVGNTEVGKTSIIKRITGEEFHQHELATIGVDFKNKFVKLGKYNIKVILWDTAGQERFHNITKQYFKGADGIYIVYDVTKRETFDSISGWIDEINENIGIVDTYVALVGNKIDCETERIITYEEGYSKAQANFIDYFEVSAKKNEGINDLFEKSIKGCIKNIKDKNEVSIRENNYNKDINNNFRTTLNQQLETKKHCC